MFNYLYLQSSSCRIAFQAYCFRVKQIRAGTCRTSCGLGMKALVVHSYEIMMIQFSLYYVLFVPVAQNCMSDGQLISMFLNFEDQPSATTHRCFSESFFAFYYFSPSNSSLTPNLLMNTILQQSYVFQETAELATVLISVLRNLFYFFEQTQLLIAQRCMWALFGQG